MTGRQLRIPSDMYALCIRTYCVLKIITTMDDHDDNSKDDDDSGKELVPEEVKDTWCCRGLEEAAEDWRDGRGGGVIGVERGRSLGGRAGVRSRGRTAVCREKVLNFSEKCNFIF